ncbi:hypothetical protein AB0L05_41300 [Nonomuraea pusilla]|uniref:hypothetical protein n=1 Tax=Nonomuraea pusilla TaxID=46177 RepID=UPI0033246B55
MQPPTPPTSPSGTPPASPSTPSSPGSPSGVASASPSTASGVVGCDTAIGAEASPPPGFAVVGGVVALPVRRTLQVSRVELPVGGTGWFAKQGLLVRRDRLAELTVPEELRDRFWLTWGGMAHPAARVTAGPCGGAARWVAFAGGYVVRAPACLAVRVRGRGGEQHEVRVPVGAPCPQRPSPVIR